MAALRAGPPFPPVPLIVIAASDHNDTPEREAMWQEVQARTAMLSPRGELVTVGGGHFVQRANPRSSDRHSRCGDSGGIRCRCMSIAKHWAGGRYGRG